MARYFWSDQEDNRLRELVQACHPPDWDHIARGIDSRTARQCRERYKNFLDPNLNKKDISPEEGAKIKQLVEEMGKNWAHVARRLGGRRTDNAVKNWWHKNQNRLKRLASQQQLVTDYEDHYNQNSPGPFTTVRCLPLPRTQLPPTLPLDYRHPVYPIEARLSSSCSSKPAESGARSPYTTSPARHPLVLYEFAELPPLRLPNVPTMVDLQLLSQLPSMSSLVLPADRDRVQFQPQRPSFSFQGQLPTAPDMSPQHQQQDQTHGGEDSRMKVSSILSQDSELNVMIVGGIEHPSRNNTLPPKDEYGHDSFQDVLLTGCVETQEFSALKVQSYTRVPGLEQQGSVMTEPVTV